MDAESQKAQATHVYEKPLSAGNGSLSGGITIDLKADKKLLRRIDWRVMPVVSGNQHHLYRSEHGP